MLIHSDILTAQDIRDCVPDGCYLAPHYDRHDNWGSVLSLGSRKRERSFSVRLSGRSSYAMQQLPDKAATWDEWGIFIAAIFERDPEAIVGCYKSRENFMQVTRDEYERITRSDLAKTYRAPWLGAA